MPWRYETKQRGNTFIYHVQGKSAWHEKRGDVHLLIVFTWHENKDGVTTSVHSRNKKKQTLLCLCSSPSNRLNQSKEPGRQAVSQSVLPSLCTPSPWWLWWAAWPSAWWALRSESRTVPQGKLQTPRHSPGTTKHAQIQTPTASNVIGPVSHLVCCFGKPWPKRFRSPGFLTPCLHTII